jgi:hypothetical protein
VPSNNSALPEYVVLGQYRYRLVCTQYSSSKFGVCEQCGTHASEIWYQMEERRYFPERFIPSLGEGEHWTGQDCHDLFGHKECLEAYAKRRANARDCTNCRHLGWTYEDTDPEAGYSPKYNICLVQNEKRIDKPVVLCVLWQKEDQEEDG